MLCALERLHAHDPTQGVPPWLLMQARMYGPTAADFLRTNCQATVSRLRHLLLPDESRWRECTTLPPGCTTYMVQFGDDHEFMVINARHVIQAYAFKHGAQQSAFNPSLPLYTHVSRNAEEYQSIPPTFFVPLTGMEEEEDRADRSASVD